MSNPPREPQVEIIPPEQASSRGPRPGPGDIVPHGEARRRRSPGKVLLSMIPGVNTAYALWLYLGDDQAPDLHRLMILGALIYLLSPFDFIDDFLLPFGFIDDAAVIMFLIKFIGSKALAPYRMRARELLRQP